jgi:hypothetical protein
MEFDATETTCDCNLSDIFGSLITLYNSLTPVLNAKTSTLYSVPTRDQCHSIQSDIVNNFRINELIEPVVENKGQPLARELRILTGMLESNANNQNKILNDLVLKQFVSSMNNFHEYLSIFDSVSDKKDQLVDSYYKIFAVVAGACIANYFLVKPVKGNERQDIQVIDAELSRGV